jgi:hypothetical protein
MGLRTYGGDTSFPGGKMEPKDRSVEDTAVSSQLALDGLLTELIHSEGRPRRR